MPKQHRRCIASLELASPVAGPIGEQHWHSQKSSETSFSFHLVKHRCVSTTITTTRIAKPNKSKSQPCLLPPEPTCLALIPRFQSSLLLALSTLCTPAASKSKHTHSMQRTYGVLKTCQTFSPTAHVAGTLLAVIALIVAVVGIFLPIPLTLMRSAGCERHIPVHLHSVAQNIRDLWFVQ